MTGYRRIQICGKKPARNPAILIVAVLLTFTTAVLGQEDKLPKGVAPPPLSVLTKDEKKLLVSEKNMKARTKLALTLMDSRLIKANEYAEKEEFKKSLDQLGSFHAILRNTLNYLKAFEGRKRTAKNFKRFEMTLRKFLPRLELIRRKTPFKYAYHVRRLVKNVRDARRTAIEPLFEDTVIPEKTS